MIDTFAMKRHLKTLAPLTLCAPAGAAGCALGVAMLLGGCYKNVVGVKGPASRNFEVHEANIQQGESVWATDGPRPVDTERYGSNGTTLDRAKPIPPKKPKSSD